MFAWFLSFHVMYAPSLERMPLPASGNHCQSLPVCGPYLAMEKLGSLERFGPSLATQPIIGIVSIACAPADFEFEMKVSPRSPAVALASAILSKYQSLPRLSPLSCQLYREVLFPPLRLSGTLRSLSAA